jgi:hypothetical protein
LPPFLSSSFHSSQSILHIPSTWLPKHLSTMASRPSWYDLTSPGIHSSCILDCCVCSLIPQVCSLVQCATLIHAFASTSSVNAVTGDMAPFRHVSHGEYATRSVRPCRRGDSHFLHDAGTRPL